MLIALLEVSLYLGSVMYGFIRYTVTVIYGGGTPAIMFLCCDRGVWSNGNNVCSEGAGRQYLGRTWEPMG